MTSSLISGIYCLMRAGTTPNPATSQGSAQAAEQPLRRILQDPHRVVQAIAAAAAADRLAARQALQTEFDITRAPLQDDVIGASHIQALREITIIRSTLLTQHGGSGG